ncbi:MAG: hypothetical protein K6T17_06005 [Fimbriimonadales bacterium]|nr:hypothetical protein [Fimbriimonadales bacterium]
MTSPYPRPDAPGEFLADKVIGIILIVLSVLGGICICPGMSLAGLGALGAGEVGAIAGGALAGLGAATGFIVIVLSAVGVAIGYGIMKGLRWGFLVGAILSGISVVFSLVGFNVLGFLLNGALCAYCILRLTGRLGPPVP